MKKLIVCCDGTWNTPDQRQNDIPAPTNVVRLHNALAKTDANGVEQRKYYHTGVGTEGSKLERVAGGAYGSGISMNIMSAYAWLANNYADGDMIYLFGFSRGAFTARSLGGFIGRCGLLDLGGIPHAEAWERVEQVYQKSYEKTDHVPADWAFHAVDPASDRVPIQFIGVWDTVGALGIPDDLAVLNLFDDPTKWQFHDTTLGAHVRFARHAVAIDEVRASFTPTFWTDANDNVLNQPDTPAGAARVKQLWFPGAHCDVGGGYADCGLSDGALQWMIDEAQVAGLAFRADMLEQIDPTPRGVLHDSYSGGFEHLQSRPRNRPQLTPASPHYHESAVAREATPPITQSPYHHPTVALAVGETSEPIDIYARNAWNETGLYLAAGATYTFAATGEWLDKDVPCGPGGTADRKFHLGEVAHLASSFLGKIENAVNKLKDNPGVNFVGTKRHEAWPWFALIGAIANDGPQNGVNPTPDGSPSPHQTFLIGERTPAPLTIKPTEDGYLFAYANDAWGFYENNRGSVSLRVTRVS